MHVHMHRDSETTHYNIRAWVTYEFIKEKEGSYAEKKRRELNEVMNPVYEDATFHLFKED